MGGVSPVEGAVKAFAIANTCAIGHAAFPKGARFPSVA